jgi:signal transduction histidine kinase/HAMP domain-containing protein
MPRLVPSTIRGQLITGTVLLQCLLVAIFVGYVYRQQSSQLHARTHQRLLYQVHVLADAAAQELEDQHLVALQSITASMPASPTIRATRITDLSGRVLAYGDREGPGSYVPLSPAEMEQMQPPYRVHVFDAAGGTPEVVAPVLIDGTPIALAWIVPDMTEDQTELSYLLDSALLFALLAVMANAVVSLLLARSITQPLRGLLRGTQLLIRDPEIKNVFPIHTRSRNEAGVLTRAFNTMVAALNEQRTGLNDTLALLDSMLANAPIGFAFFDYKARYVRVNQFLAEINNLPISRHLGRPIQEVFPTPEAREIARIVQQIFKTGAPVRDVELSGELPTMPGLPRTWLINFYPVRTGTDHVRWVGAVVVDATERKQSEEALRRTEKLAATGRLAASIAHEINNPLEAVTNLLYLLRYQPSLDEEAVRYAEMAQHEVERMSQITQQTLRFYRQSTRPTATRFCEVLDSVLVLYQGRLHAMQVEVVRRYNDNIELFAFAGELRQLFANLVGNAIDAMPQGGRLLVSVRASRDWRDGKTPGARVIVADTGCGMSPSVRKRIFEPFFTTKEVTGTGLGLWVSAEIVEKHRGVVRVRSRVAAQETSLKDTPTSGTSLPASGTIFMIFFPHNGVLRTSPAEGPTVPLKTEAR